MAAVQQALIEKGYHEVGEPDGKPGTKTGGAILAFEADNELDLVGKPTPGKRCSGSTFFGWAF